MLENVIVAIQGQPGSYHDVARKRYFDNGHELLCRDTFAAVFSDVASGQADYGLVAIENSLYGSINDVYDLLLKHRLWIGGEVYTTIHHCLLGTDADIDIADIQTVHSHALAFAQCEDYLTDQLPQAQRSVEADTAGSAALVARHANPHVCAIASREAAALHDLVIVAADIESNPHNYTRFIVLQRHPHTEEQADKTSIILRTDHKPGSLYKALGAFYDHNINLAKLESRPIVGTVWDYQFYLDFEAGLHKPRVEQTLDQLRSTGCEIIELGTYIAGNNNGD